MGFENEVEQLNSDLTAMVCRSDSPSHLLRASAEFVYSRYVCRDVVASPQQQSLPNRFCNSSNVCAGAEQSHHHCGHEVNKVNLSVAATRDAFVDLGARYTSDRLAAGLQWFGSKVRIRCLGF
jgi:hypothetical protein